MNRKLKTLIDELNLSIKEEQILAFLDGKLRGNEFLKIQEILEKNKEFKIFCDEFKKFMENTEQVSPPKTVHNNLLKSLGLKEKDIFDICLQMLDDGIKIITGENLLMTNSPIPAFRSNQNTDLFFKKKIQDIIINCNFNPINNNELNAHFKINSNDNHPLNNVQIKIYEDSTLVKSLVTNSVGVTKSINLIKGDYEIVIRKKEKLGTINISLSK